MAQKAGFVSGANAKIQIFGKTLAYCQDVSYSVDVTSIPIESMGKYEVHSYEPVAYSIQGTFSIIRYTKRAKASSIDASSDQSDGNAPERIGGMGKHLDPARLLESETFDMIITEKTSESEANAVYSIHDCRIVRRSMTLNKRGVMTDSYQFMGIRGTDDDGGQVTGPSGPKDLSA